MLVRFGMYIRSHHTCAVGASAKRREQGHVVKIDGRSHHSNTRPVAAERGYTLAKHVASNVGGNDDVVRSVQKTRQRLKNQASATPSAMMQQRRECSEERHLLFCSKERRNISCASASAPCPSLTPTGAAARASSDAAAAVARAAACTVGWAAASAARCPTAHAARATGGGARSISSSCSSALRRKSRETEFRVTKDGACPSAAHRRSTHATGPSSAAAWAGGCTGGGARCVKSRSAYAEECSIATGAGGGATHSEGGGGGMHTRADDEGKRAGGGRGSGAASQRDPQTSLLLLVANRQAVRGANTCLCIPMQRRKALTVWRCKQILKICFRVSFVGSPPRQSNAVG